jgi:hypothetical protein
MRITPSCARDIAKELGRPAHGLVAIGNNGILTAC